MHIEVQICVGPCLNVNVNSIRPKYDNEDLYDEYCVYANRVALFSEQEVILGNICEDNTPRIDCSPFP